MKEGKKTTEFYLSIFGAVLGVVVTMGILTPEQSSTLVGSAAQISGAVISALSVLGYGVSRGLAKKNFPGV